jgi:hypothetical protein
MKCGLLPICQEAIIIGPVSYHDFQGIVDDVSERDSIAHDLGPTNKVSPSILSLTIPFLPPRFFNLFLIISLFSRWLSIRVDCSERIILPQLPHVVVCSEEGGVVAGDVVTESRLRGLRHYSGRGAASGLERRLGV